MKTLLVLIALASIAGADPLAVTIKPATVTWYANAPVDVVLEVANSSKTPQSIKVWLCSWDDNWKSSDPELAYTPRACDKNFERDEVLAPGASRNWTLPMFATATAARGPHELKMGFTAGGRAQQWSSPVTITVADPVELSIKPATTTWKIGAKVDVVIEAKNLTREKRSLSLMSCSWGEHVTSSDPALIWDPWACRKNGLTGFEIEPGKSRTWTLKMFAKPDTKPGAHPFQLTLTPKGGEAIQSKPVTITVTK